MAGRGGGGFRKKIVLNEANRKCSHKIVSINHNYLFLFLVPEGKFLFSF